MPKIPSPNDLWKRHEELVLEVFTVALTLLCKEADLPLDEDDISKILAVEVREANFQLNRESRGLPFPPRWENPVQPTSKEDLSRKGEPKRSDFSCPFRDDAAPSHEEAYLDYHVECKRLGNPPSARWTLNKNYVSNGVLRFLDPDYSYGRGTWSAAMIGYVQSMEATAIIAEINDYISKEATHAIPDIGLEGGCFRDGRVSRTSQHFVRRQLAPSSFDLRHLWVDLRS